MANLLDVPDQLEEAATAPPSAPSLFDVPDVAPNSALGEIYTGARVGATVDLPSLLGKAIKRAGPSGGSVERFAQETIDNAALRAKSPENTLNPAAQNKATNFFTSGTKILTPSLGIIGGIAASVLGAGAAVGAAGLTAAGAAIAGTATAAAGIGAAGVFSLAQAHDTYAAGKANDLSDEAANRAANSAGVLTFGTELAENFLGVKLLGLAGSVIPKSAASKLIDGEAAPLATAALKELTGGNSAVAATARQLAHTAVGGVAVQAIQAGGVTAIENNAGITDASVTDAIKDSIAPVLAASAILAPFGVANRALRRAAAKTNPDTLSSRYATPADRTRSAEHFATELAKVDPQGAVNFKTNADAAIADHGTRQFGLAGRGPDAADCPPGMCGGQQGQHERKREGKGHERNSLVYCVS